MAIKNRQKIVIATAIAFILILTFSTVALASVEKPYLFSRFKNFTNIFTNSKTTDHNRAKEKTSVIIAPDDPLSLKQSEKEKKPTLTISSWQLTEKPLLKENSQKIQSPSAIEKKPKMASPIEVNYPLKARRLGWEGITSLEVTILSTGEIEEIKVISKSGYDLLDDSAIKAIRATKFIPGNSTQAMKISCSVEFSLK